MAVFYWLQVATVFNPLYLNTITCFTPQSLDMHYSNDDCRNNVCGILFASLQFRLRYLWLELIISRLQVCDTLLLLLLLKQGCFTWMHLHFTFTHCFTNVNLYIRAHLAASRCVSDEQTEEKSFKNVSSST